MKSAMCMETSIKFTTVAAALLLLAGCASTPRRDPQFASVRPAEPVTTQYNTGGIYQASQAIDLFEDKTARRVGDTITVVLVESTSASKNASTSTKKSNNVDIANPTLFGSPVQFNLPSHFPLASTTNNDLSMALSSSKEFKGAGDSSQGNSLTGNITVTVTEVLANGNLVVRGEKLLTLNQGDEHIRISGIVRRADIHSDNTILSNQVADAQIIYTGSGDIANSNDMGWLARFFNSKWWPF
jgi:flagellar L-ring protein precursor FlgH